jgi:glucokinase
VSRPVMRAAAPVFDRTISDEFSVGVDFGGTNLRFAAYSPKDGVLESVTLPSRVKDGRDAVVADMCAGIRDLIARHSKSRKLKGIGMGSPGPIELPGGLLHDLPNLPGFGGLELRATLEKNLGTAVIIENDANAAALAECFLGRGKTLGIDSLCMMTLGTGVGGGIILQGNILDGMNGFAGEVGHVNIWTDGLRCGCGGHGCTEPYASATSVRRAAKDAIATGTAPGLAALAAKNPDFTPRDVGLLAEAGDADAIRIFENLGQALGIALSAIVNTLNLPLYLIGGGLLNAWDLFAPALFKELRSRSYIYRLTEPSAEDLRTHREGKTYIEKAELGGDAGFLGACLLPFTTWPEARR